MMTSHHRRKITDKDVPSYRANLECGIMSQTNDTVLITQVSSWFALKTDSSAFILTVSHHFTPDLPTAVSCHVTVTMNTA